MLTASEALSVRKPRNRAHTNTPTNVHVCSRVQGISSQGSFVYAIPVLWFTFLELNGVSYTDLGLLWGGGHLSRVILCEAHLPRTHSLGSSLVQGLYWGL